MNVLTFYYFVNNSRLLFILNNLLVLLPHACFLVSNYSKEKSCLGSKHTHDSLDIFQFTSVIEHYWLSF